VSFIRNNNKKMHDWYQLHNIFMKLVPLNDCCHLRTCPKSFYWITIKEEINKERGFITVSDISWQCWHSIKFYLWHVANIVLVRNTFWFCKEHVGYVAYQSSSGQKLVISKFWPRGRGVGVRISILSPTELYEIF
jgi:hypothetical protein